MDILFICMIILAPVQVASLFYLASISGHLSQLRSEIEELKELKNGEQPKPY